MESKHTKTPWTFEHTVNARSGLKGIMVNGNRCYIAEMSFRSVTPEEGFENAKIICDAVNNYAELRKAVNSSNICLRLIAEDPECIVKFDKFQGLTDMIKQNNELLKRLK